MAILFVIFIFALVLILSEKRKAAIFCIFLGILLSIAMLWYHADDILQINL